MIFRRSFFKTMPLTLIKVRGSCRVRYVEEPFDQGTDAEISRLSPRSVDPESYNCQSLTPPPFWIKTTRDAFDRN